VRGAVDHLRQSGDILIVSLYWGGNWGQEVPIWQRELGGALIEEAEVNVVFGHSSHHPKAIETVGNGTDKSVLCA
jgi:poly-gamma-glutamate capsule biosynthesis protein CapA/YwtB (metallophosphatase superfamily)